MLLNASRIFHSDNAPDGPLILVAPITVGQVLPNPLPNFLVMDLPGQRTNNAFAKCLTGQGIQEIQALPLRNHPQQHQPKALDVNLESGLEVALGRLNHVLGSEDAHFVLLAVQDFDCLLEEGLGAGQLDGLDHVVEGVVGDTQRTVRLPVERERRRAHGVRVYLDYLQIYHQHYNDVSRSRHFAHTIIILIANGQNSRQPLRTFVVTQTDHSRGEFLALMITQVIIIAILFGLLVMWHVKHAKLHSEALEIEKAYLRERSMNREHSKQATGVVQGTHSQVAE